MAWSASAVFKQYTSDSLAPTASFTPHLASGGTWKAALYNNTGTPDNTALGVLCAYNGAASQWVTANEITDANWPAGGRPLVYTGGTGALGTRWTTTGAVAMLDADDTAGAGNVTITGVQGDLVYDDALTTPVAKQALGYHWYGGAQQVTAGTFTVIWNSLGVIRWTH